MSVINIVKNAKEEFKEYVIMIKIGKFYNCYGRDAYIISYLFDYKIRIIDDVYICAFPESAYNKVIANLEQKKINYIVLDKRNNYDEDSKSDNGNLNTYNEIYAKAKQKISLKMRVEKIYRYLLECKDENTVFKMECIINERRKIQGD